MFVLIEVKEFGPHSPVQSDGICWVMEKKRKERKDVMGSTGQVDGICWVPSVYRIISGV